MGQYKYTFYGFCSSTGSFVTYKGLLRVEWAGGGSVWPGANSCIPRWRHIFFVVDRIPLETSRETLQEPDRGLLMGSFRDTALTAFSGTGDSVGRECEPSPQLAVCVFHHTPQGAQRLCGFLRGCWSLCWLRLQTVWVPDSEGCNIEWGRRDLRWNWIVSN